MGRVQHGSRTKGSAKSQGKGRKTKRYQRDLDQVELDLRLAHAVRSVPSSSSTPAKVAQQFGGTAHPTVTGDADEETPGFGEWPCQECARFFADERSLVEHRRAKVHKRRVKALKGGAFTVEDSQRAAGLGVDNRQRPPLRRADGSLNAEALLALPARAAPSPMTDTMTQQLEAVRVS